MSTEYDYPKKYWWLVLIVVPLIAAIIPNLLNNREQKPSLPEKKPQGTTQERVLDGKHKMPIQIPSMAPSPKATPESIMISKDIAVLIVANENKIDWTIGSMVASLLKKQGISITTPSLFNNSFLISGGFNRLFAGSLRKSELAELSQQFKSGVFGKKTVTYVKNTNLGDIITATLILELHVISSKTGTVNHSVSFSQRGVGFSNFDASKIAEDRIFRELETNITAIIKNF